MKKIVAIAAVAMLSFALAGCGSSGTSSSAQSSAASSAASAASASASTSASAASVSTQSVSVKWIDAATAEDAAKGAGLTKFGVMDSVKIGSNEFKDPTFGYSDGVAQAVYETGAVSLTVRKSDAQHTSLLTDRKASEFPNTWTKSYEGVDVTLWGQDKDAATVFQWTDGNQSYGVTYQGLGGEEVTMQSSEVAAIVKGLKAANTGSSKTSSADSASKSSESASASQAQIGTAAAVAGGAVAAEYDDDEVVYAEGDEDEETPGLSEDDAVDIAEQTSGGEATNVAQAETDEYGTVWQVTTEDDEGNVTSYYVDENGDTYDVE